MFFFSFPYNLFRTQKHEEEKRNIYKRGIEHFSQIFMAHKNLLPLRSMNTFNSSVHTHAAAALESRMNFQIKLSSSSAACEDSIFKSAHKST